MHTRKVIPDEVVLFRKVEEFLHHVHNGAFEEFTPMSTMHAPHIDYHCPPNGAHGPMFENNHIQAIV